ncbi:MAG: hypothetical protein PHW73_09515 [Atribacterota bacterium]|nr:hypothetical protein [Atribacterota bacterium]
MNRIKEILQSKSKPKEKVTLLSEEIKKDKLKNTHDKGTVVCWSTAFALGEVAKNQPTAAKRLLPKIKALAEQEANNGVKNVYLKTLKVLKKEKK